MTQRIRIAAAMAVLLLGAETRLQAGGIHIRYRAGAPARMGPANVRYYQGVLNLYHNHPAWFREHHPFYTRMFNHPQVLEKMLGRWHAHPQRFEYWHDCLWKVLDGYETSHPVLPPASPAQSNGDETGSAGGGNTAQQNLDPPPSDNQISTVPEPTGAVLLAAGLGSLCLARLARRRSRSGRR